MNIELCDSVSCVRIAPTDCKIYQDDSDIKCCFALSTWDGKLLVFKIKNDLSTDQLKQIKFNGPIMSLSWRLDKQGLLISHSDGKVYSNDLFSTEKSNSNSYAALFGHSQAVVGAY